MTLEDRKDRAVLHFQLMNLLADNCVSDETFLKHLIWAKRHIEIALQDFTQEEIDAISND